MCIFPFPFVLFVLNEYFSVSQNFNTKGIRKCAVATDIHIPMYSLQIFHILPALVFLSMWFVYIDYRPTILIRLYHLKKKKDSQIILLYAVYINSDHFRRGTKIRRVYEDIQFVVAETKLAWDIFCSFSTP